MKRTATVPGKWVLAGEHTVLLGGEALAFPNPELSLTLQLDPNSHATHPDTEAILGRIRSRLAGLGLALPEGAFEIKSTIPLGSGFGSSAALSVALVRIIDQTSGLDGRDPFELAREIEGVFHGQSSGMDIAAVMAPRGIAYRRGTPPIPLKIQKEPRFSFHDTGLRASTRQCIAKVSAFRGRSVAIASAVDESMKLAVADAKFALEGGDFATLGVAMTRAHACFEAWGLVPSSIQAGREALLAQGARAVKLTGAGDGGFWVALWS